ncbi:MAG: hypothetical protein AABW87_03495 [Nanoarchaeota archaeon]
MNKKRGRTIKLGDSSEKTPSKSLSEVLKQDKIVVERIKELANILKAKYNITTKDLIYLTDEKEVLIPVSIFTKKLSILEAITKYFKENLDFNYHKIGGLLNRNERNIWHTYKNACKKHPSKIEVSESKYFIPASIFQNELGAMENVALYMKDQLDLSFHNIAVLLERDDRTIWTMWSHARKKTKAK